MALRRRKLNQHADAAALADELNTVLRVLNNYPSGTVPPFGAPTRCPRCINYGLVLGLDGFLGGRSFNRCVSCGAEWMITARALRAARSASTSAPAAAVASATGASSLEFALGLVGPASRAPSASLIAPDTTGVLFSRSADGDVNRELVRPGSGPAPRPVPAVAAEAESPIVPRHEGPMRILLVEDDPFDIDIVKAILSPVGDDTIDLRTARTRADGEKAARSTAPDLVLLDLGLPDSHGFATVTRWHFSKVGDAPVLVVSGSYGADILDRGHEFGVSGFLDKTELADLLAKGDEGTSLFLDRLVAAAAG